jgi:hypothetical protein
VIKLSNLNSFQTGKDAFDFGVKWAKRKKYILDGRKIVAEKNNHELKHYYPFKFHKTSVSKVALNKIFSESRNNVDEMPLHLSFANLDPNNDDEILAWINEFGLPFWSFNSHPDERKAIYDKEDSGKLTRRNKNAELLNSFYIETTLHKKVSAPLNNAHIPIKEIDSLVGSSNNIYIGEVREEIHRLKLMIQIQNALVKNSVEEISYEFIPLLNQWRILLVDFDESIMVSDKEQDEILLMSAKNYLEVVFNMILEDVRPKLKIGEQPIWQWNFTSLLSAMYLMLFLDFTGSNLPRQCLNKSCNNFFKPARDSNVYCRQECQENAKVQRYRDRKKKEVIQLYINGETIEQIAKRTKIESRRIKGWINNIKK